MQTHNLIRLTAGLFSLLLLASCSSGGTPTAAPAVEQSPAADSSYPTPVTNSGIYPTPGGGPQVDDIPTSGAYPPPEAGGAINDWSPRPEDANLQRGEVQINTQDILTAESMPPQFSLNLEGTLPTPCHQLRVEFLPSSPAGIIEVSVYSVVDPSMMCTQVLEPFTARAPIEGQTSGSYQVVINGVQAGEIEVP